MTIKQRDFITSLVSERVIPADAKGTYVLKLVAGTAREPNPAQASAIIEWLMALPRKAVTETADVPAGRYALVHPERSIVEFFTVDRPKDGRWAGRTFVNQQASDDKYPVRGARATEVLARIAEDPRAAMIRYGHELGRCGNCGRTLTDEVSRAMGIGPDCAANLGIERISEAEAVAQTPPPAPVEVETREEALDAYREDGSESSVVWKPTVSRDKKGVPNGVGGWRARKRYEQEARSDERKERDDKPCSQKTVLPGESWEDIFGGGA